MSEAIDHDRIRAIETAANPSGDVIQVITSFATAHQERAKIAKEILSCKNSVDFIELNRIFDCYTDQIKLVLGII